jgi:endonuclease III
MPGKKPIDAPTSLSPVKKDIPALLALLDALYPDARCSLEHSNPLQLLVATILSAQCTDERVNQVAPALFEKYPSAASYAEAPAEELEADIRSTGFYRNKARSIQGCCRILHQKYQGSVPSDLETLVQLPGIGRKTANVILGNAYGIPGIVVDTHVGRLSQRIGLTRNKVPEKIEQDLMAQIPRERWTRFGHQLIAHGRQLCLARRPKCDRCPLRPHCDYGSQQVAP